MDELKTLGDVFVYAEQKLKKNDIMNILDFYGFMQKLVRVIYNIIHEHYSVKETVKLYLLLHILSRKADTFALDKDKVKNLLEVINSFAVVVDTTMKYKNQPLSSYFLKVFTMKDDELLEEFKMVE
jgi:hypothetical protein